MPLVQACNPYIRGVYPMYGAGVVVLCVGIKTARGWRSPPVGTRTCSACLRQ